MKKIFTLLLAGVTTLAAAQKKQAEVPVPPTPPTLEIYSSDRWAHGIEPKIDPYGKVFEGLDAEGFRKHVKYNAATGELFLQYHFRKNDEEYVYEKTVNAAEKSEKERQEIIRKFEKEIGLPRNEMQM